jgi:hypothetical protein
LRVPLCRLRSAGFCGTAERKQWEMLKGRRLAQEGLTENKRKGAGSLRVKGLGKAAMTKKRMTGDSADERRVENASGQSGGR